MAEIIKAQDVRAGDTLRVTFDITIDDGRRGLIGSGRGRWEISSGSLDTVLSNATTIERMAPPLKVGDRVQCAKPGTSWSVLTLLAIVDFDGEKYAVVDNKAGGGTQPGVGKLADYRRYVGDQQ